MSEPGNDNMDEPEVHLQELGPQLEQALALRGAGKDEEAIVLLREILKAEPRLAEPRLELSHIAASASDWREAEAQARLAVDTLRGGGQWTLDLEANELLSFALNLLGEVVVRGLEEGDLLMTNRPEFVERWNEASGFFREALEGDNSNKDARSNCIHYRPMEEVQPSPDSGPSAATGGPSSEASSLSSPTTE